ncbi:MAG: hypothetical protein COC06_11725 [Bacteroidales bacterium]|nr:MAG: hypothetical protein COC06_11725 [Bacteroidales bacterium]
MKKQIKNTHYLIILLLILALSTKAQEVENEFQSRTSITLSTKLLKNLKVSISPELRFDENFSLDKSLLEGKASYKLFDHFSLGAGYRFYANKRESKSTEYYNRYSLIAKYTKSYYRFDPSLKVSYSNFSDDESDSNMLRYKAAVKYNIRKSKFTPYAGLEFVQQTKDGDLHKTRYFIGTNYKICKKNYIEASYKFDYFQNEFKNRHIVSIGYKLKI